MVNFLGARRRTGPKPVVKSVAEAEAFLANEPVPVQPLNMVPLISEGAALRTIIPMEFVYFIPLSSSINTILSDIDIETLSEGLIGMECDKVGRPIAMEKVIEETVPWVPTHVRFRTLTPTKVPTLNPTLAGVREGSAAGVPPSNDFSMIRPAEVSWIVSGDLARFGGDLKGNPFQALVDLIPHESLNMERDTLA